MSVSVIIVVFVGAFKRMGASDIRLDSKISTIDLGNRISGTEREGRQNEGRDEAERFPALLIALHSINACKGRLQVHSGFHIAVAIFVGYL